MRRQHDRRAAAAASARVHVLFLCIINQQAAVIVSVADIDIFLREQFKQCLLPNAAQIPCKDGIIILRLSAKIFQIPRNRPRRGRRHRTAHIKRIFNAEILNPPDCNPGDAHFILILALVLVLDGLAGHGLP